VRLLQSPEEVVPMVWGPLCPVLVLPASAEGWGPERAWLVLLHELAHVKRADCLLQLLSYLACALYWWNPLVWLAARRLRSERERACDDVVLAAGPRATDYASHLIALARDLRPPGLAAVAAVPMARHAGLARRVRDLLDSGRNRGGVGRRGALVSGLALLALLAPLARVPTLAADTPAGHRPGLRDQWQPQTEHDPRLAQPVHIEILGRAAAPALELLSKESGVSLSVAPENLETVGDRKLTVIAQGCSLKSLMVQIPNALQECHWDVDVTGKEPVYLLHRNAGAEATMAELAEAETRHLQEEGRAFREERVESTRKALAMSPEELAELAKTDPLMVASVKDPDARAQMELFVSLPSEAMQEFLTTGSATLSYTSAPERFQQGCQDLLRRHTESSKERGDSGLSDLYAYGLGNPDAVSFTYANYDRPEWPSGTWLGVNVFRPDGGAVMGSSAWHAATPPRAPRNDEYDLKSWRDMFVQAGLANDKSAEVLATDLARKREREAREARDARRAAEWREPRSPELHKVVTLPFEEKAEVVEVQQFLAKESGLSFISDYFTTWGPQDVPEEAKAAMPAWRLMYLLGENWVWRYDWNEAGDCVVFHDRRWYDRVGREMPESLVGELREKLSRQGCLTVDDIASAAAELERRRPASPALQRGWIVVPEDLQEAGAHGNALASPALLLYASLTLEQKEKARGPRGLRYQEMTARQQNLARRSSTTGNDRRPLLEDQLTKAVFRATERAETVESKPKLVYEFRVEFPTRAAGTGLYLDPPKEAAPPVQP
jgi:hypothetical protein